MSPKLGTGISPASLGTSRHSRFLMLVQQAAWRSERACGYAGAHEQGL